MGRLTGEPDPPVNAELYPDVVASGGLATAIRETARRLGADLGAVTTAEPQPYSAVTMPASRGPVHVFADEGRRRFRINLWHGTRPAAAGATAELSEVVGVTELWQRGAPLRELKDRFPFMEYTRSAQAFEDGNELEVLWVELLEDPDQHRIRPLLLAARSSERLARWYPVVSHRTAARFMERLHDKSAGQVFVDLAGDGTCTVWASWEPEHRTVPSVGEAVTTAEDLLAGRAPS
jgi:hypothetical protein